MNYREVSETQTVAYLQLPLAIRSERLTPFMEFKSTLLCGHELGNLITLKNYEVLYW
jgi:hypothetical protein